MKYYSEKLKKLFDSEAELKAAEIKANEAENKEQEMRKKRAEAAKIVDEKYKKKIDADKEYHDALDDFCKKYGSYHKTYTSSNIPRSNADIFTDLYDIVNAFIYNK